MSYDLLIRSTPAEEGTPPAASRAALVARVAALAGVQPNGDFLVFGDGETHWMEIRFGESEQGKIELLIPYGFLSERTAPDYVRVAWQIADALGWTEILDQQNGQWVPREGPLSFRVPRIAHPFNRKPIAVRTRWEEQDEALVGARDLWPSGSLVVFSTSG